MPATESSHAALSAPERSRQGRLSDPRERLSALFRVMVASREIDRLEEELTRRGEAFFHVSGAGHEATATLAFHLTPEDWLHAHYRDKALLLARGMTPKALFDSLFCKDESHSRGRQMSAHLCDPDRNILSIVGPVGNNALQAAGVAHAVKHRPGQPIVLCSVGDGTTQQGEWLEAVAEAVRWSLPVLFLVEDNRYAISVTTPGKTFYSRPDGEAEEFYGLPIRRVSGHDVLATDRLFGETVAAMRTDRGPRIVVIECERLSNHTNADDQRIYRDHVEIGRLARERDPIAACRRELLRQGLTENDLDRIVGEVHDQVAAAEEQSALGPEPTATMTCKRSLPTDLAHPDGERPGTGEPTLTMREALRTVLRHHLATDDRVTLYGQDIEDPKGDVFGVTKGLSTDFPGRVVNSPLTESTILGASIGRAIAGDRPVAFLQFADFFPLAYNQIVSELGSLHWRTDGRYEAPVIVMVACGAYRPGLGPFHAQSFEAVAAHTPGIDVVMPSTAADAAGLLNAAFASGRPTIFFYPKSLLNDTARRTSADVVEQRVPLGIARRVRAGRDITLVGWGNTLVHLTRCADELERVGIEADLLDLRSISPWDQAGVVASASRTGRLLVVHEDNHTCGFGAEILATVAEHARRPVKMKRLARPDTFVPCNFPNQLEVLPSFRKVLTAAAELLELDLSWTEPHEATAGKTIDAVGSGPSDETVTVTELYIRAGDTVRRGQTIASLEASKSVFDLTSPHEGVIDTLLIVEGDVVPVGSPIARLAVDGRRGRPKPLTTEPAYRPVLSRPVTTVSRPAESLDGTNRVDAPHFTTVRGPQLATETAKASHDFEPTGPVSSRNGTPRRLRAGIAGISTVLGSRKLSNDELLAIAPPALAAHVDAEEIVRKTGIRNRFWVGEGETVVSLGIEAARKALDQAGLRPEDLDMLLVATATPNKITPSVACQILGGLSGRGSEGPPIPAFDINAACSGYLYALQIAQDRVLAKPDANVLLVTAEVLSPLLDLADVDTAIIFGDAATATLIVGEAGFDASARFRLLSADLSAKSDQAEALAVPLPGKGCVSMRGRTVFSEAVRAMTASLHRVCEAERVAVDDLRMIVPHQANQRILDAIQGRVGAPVYSNIADHGNTSSSSIPLCLADLSGLESGQRIGLTAFGGGFTFGASLIEVV